MMYSSLSGNAMACLGCPDTIYDTGHNALYVHDVGILVLMCVVVVANVSYMRLHSLAL